MRLRKHSNTARAATIVVSALAVLWVLACTDRLAGPAAAPPDTLHVQAGPGHLAVGDTVRLGVELRDAGGRALAVSAVAWSSSDPEIATVSPSGVVTAVAPGVVMVTATSGTASTTAYILVTDPAVAVLSALYLAAGGVNWTRSDNWGRRDIPIGDWYGVETAESGRVVAVDLPDNNLRGRIPPELGDLASLRRLDLSGNRLTGLIPPELHNIF